MKAIQELVGYFERRGRLTSKQIDRLLKQGFLAADAPPNMMALGDQIGQTFYFRLTGDPVGHVWGTEVYTGDSTLAAVAVHAGVLKAGETGVVRVTVVQPLKKYTGSAANGVTSASFGPYNSAFRIEAV